MKAGRFAAAAAVAAAGANAQAVYASSSVPVSYTTVTYDVCPTSVVQSMITVTNGVTVTYCPECEMGGMPTPAPSGADTTHTTVYTTTYLSLCPTGTVPATYTVTETCTGSTPSFNTESSHIPPGFTVSTGTCHVCGPTPVPVTITEPCGCMATEGVPVTQPYAQPTGSAMGPGGSAAPPAMGPGGSAAPPAMGPGGSAAPPAMGSGCPGPNCMGGSSAPTTTMGSGAPPVMRPGCPGPNCMGGSGMTPSAMGPGASGSGMMAPIKPTPSPSQTTGCPGGTNCPAATVATYTGAASPANAVGMASSVFAALVAALAFGL